MVKRSRGEDYWGYIKTQEGVDNTFKMHATMETGPGANLLGFLKKKQQQLAAVKDKFLEYDDEERRGPKSADREEYLRNVAAWMETQQPMIDGGFVERKTGQIAVREGYLEKHGLHKLESDRPATFDSVVDACKQLQGFSGYAFIGFKGLDAKGKARGHAIAVYYSEDCVRVMDANHGEIGANSGQVGLTGLEAHINSYFKPGILGDAKRQIEVELYPYPQRPDRVEDVAARVKGRRSEAETEGASKLNNDNNAQSVVNSNHDVPATENSGGDPE